MNLRLYDGDWMALKVIRPASMERKTFSSFFISAAVCSGLLITNGLAG